MIITDPLLDLFDSFAGHRQRHATLVPEEMCKVMVSHDELAITIVLLLVWEIAIEALVFDGTSQTPATIAC